MCRGSNRKGAGLHLFIVLAWGCQHGNGSVAMSGAGHDAVAITEDGSPVSPPEDSGHEAADPQKLDAAPPDGAIAVGELRFEPASVGLAPPNGTAVVEL